MHFGVLVKVLFCEILRDGRPGARGGMQFGVRHVLMEKPRAGTVGRWRGPALQGRGAKNHHRRLWASRVREELAEAGPSAAKTRLASADATLEERLGEGQLSRKGQERRPASNKCAAVAERKGRGTSRARARARRRTKDAAPPLRGEDNEAAPAGPGFNERRATSAPTTPARPAG